MTRADIIGRAQTLLRETPGSEAGMNPFEWDAHVSETADDLARDSYCLYSCFTADVTSGQLLYAGCPMIEIERAEITTADASVHPLYVTEIARQNDSEWAWRQCLPVDLPRRLITAGLNQIYLWPPPNWTTTNQSATPPTPGALAIYGFSTCGKWDLPTDCCPLPDRAHPAVVYGAIVRRCEEYPELYGDRYQAMQARFRSERALLISEARDIDSASRHLGPYVNTGAPIARAASFHGFW